MIEELNIFGTTNSATTADVPTLEEMLAVVRDFEAKHPKSERITKVRCGPNMINDLQRQCERLSPVASDVFACINGLPIDRDDTIPHQLHVVEYADGTEETVGHGYKSERRPINLGESLSMMTLAELAAAVKIPMPPLIFDDADYNYRRGLMKR